MIIRDLLYLLCRPDFMQTMLLSTLLFMLPLNKRAHWQFRMLLIALPALALSVGLTWIIVDTQETVLLSLLYYPAPLIASVLCFHLCCEAEAAGANAVYGMGCAYAAQHIAFCAITILWGEPYIAEIDLFWVAASWLLQTAVLALCWVCFACRLPLGGVYAASWQKALLNTGIVIFVAMILNRVVREVWQREDFTTYAICLAYDLCSCLFILLLQLAQRRELRLQAMMEAERRLRQQAQEQYELTKESIDIINRKCHDLKHHVSALRLMQDPQEREDSLREIEERVMIYDTTAQTGNEVLDTVLTEKGLLCEMNQISWTCMANGALLDFMSPADIYILMGNALDNAIENCQTVQSVEQRIVRVSVREEYGATFIQVENYFDHPLHTEKDQYITTKEDSINHGFGLQSIRSVVERYGGTLDIETGNGRFLLSILIPHSTETNA